MVRLIIQKQGYKTIRQDAPAGNKILTYKMEQKHDEQDNEKTD